MNSFEPISLGHTCEVKYQLARNLYFPAHPAAPADAVRAIFNANYGSAHFNRHVFDFQITPFSAVCEYLERDFHGVFEREDLFVDPVTGHATHKTLWTSHPHDFEPPPEGLTDDLISEIYPQARSKFDHLAERFRRHLEVPGRFLYVFMEMRAPQEAEHLLALLTARNPAHEAHLLFVDAPERDTDYSALQGRVFKGWRRPATGKPPQYDWEGNDAGWDEALAPFTLTHRLRDRPVAAAPAVRYADPANRNTTMNAPHSAADLSELRAKGLQQLPGFFSKEDQADFARRADEIVALRKQGGLSTDSQDSQGLPYEWFEPIVRNEALLDLMRSIYGENVAAAGWRVLAKDKHFKGSVHIHQDWPYNPGSPNKVSVFVPLTRVNLANGGLIFLEESHFYGPVSMGPLDASRFPPMTEVCPSLEVGDLLVCDFLTWHYSLAQQVEEERIMLQITYMWAGDAAANNIVSGVRPHDKELHSRFDASNIPSVELNCRQARAYLEAGDVERATRYAQGLVFDDPDHAGANLLLYDILSRRNDPASVKHLEMARTAARKILREIAAREGGREDDADLESLAGAPPAGGASPWRPLDLLWTSHLPAFEHADALPAKMGTPETAWAYGAATTLIETDKPTSIRIQAQALRGEVGLCLVSEDYSNLASDQSVITPADGDTSVVIAFDPARSPARVLLRNFDDQGESGEILLKSVAIYEAG